MINARMMRILLAAGPCLPRHGARRSWRGVRFGAAAIERSGGKPARRHDRADDHGRLRRAERARVRRRGRARSAGERGDRRRRALPGQYRVAGATPHAHDLFARCQVVADPVHRRRSGRGTGAAPDRARLLSVGAKRWRESELRCGASRRASLPDDGRGPGQSRFQPQFRSSGRSQPQSQQLRHRAAEQKFRRRSQYRRHARRRFHPRPSRRGHRDGGEALSWAWFELCRQPQDARRHLRHLAGDRDRALSRRSPRRGCSTG